MSEDDVEIVRRAIETFLTAPERGDPGAAYDPAITAADFEWVLTEGTFEGKTVWSGRDEFVQFIRDWTKHFEDWSFRVARLIDAGGGRVVALTYQSATGEVSGASVEWNYGILFELRNGRIVRATNYVTHAKALKAAGLSE